MMDGVIVIDKPAGKTSHDVVNEVRKTLGIKKAGHTGTLDPLATGVLPVCLNEATKLAGFLTGEDKEYRATMLLGVKTDTMDTEGKIISQSDSFVSEEEIKSVISRMTGKIKQIPPAYSAVKYCGKPLYKWARSGVFLDLEPREVTIYSIVVEEYFFAPGYVSGDLFQGNLYQNALFGYRRCVGSGGVFMRPAPFAERNLYRRIWLLF